MHRKIFWTIWTCSLVWFLAGCDTEETPNFGTPVPCQMPAIAADTPIELTDDVFFMNDMEIVPQGINSYPLLQHIGNDNTEAVLDIFAQATELGRPLVRTNAFMDGGSSPARIRDSDGSIREEGLAALDRLVHLARVSGVKLLLVLTNNWSDYGGAGAVVDAVAPGENLPKDAFWSEPRAVAAQREYLQTIAGRKNTLSERIYGSDPAVFGWVLANEPRCVEPEWCHGPSTLVTWARTMVAALREAGAVQPIAWGGVGYLGRYGEDLEAIAEDGAVDILTFHLYPEVTYPLLQRVRGQLRVDLAIEIGADMIAKVARIAKRYRKALIVEEFGWRPPPGGHRDGERAQIYAGWIDAALYWDVPVFPWMIGERGRVDYDGFLVRPEHQLTVDAISCQFPTSQQ